MYIEQDLNERDVCRRGILKARPAVAKTGARRHTLRKQMGVPLLVAETRHLILQVDELGDTGITQVE